MTMRRHAIQVEPAASLPKAYELVCTNTDAGTAGCRTEKVSRRTLSQSERNELSVLRQLEAKVREGVAHQLTRPMPSRAAGTEFWKKVLERLDEFRAAKFLIGPGAGPSDPPQPTIRRSTMAKLVITPEIEAHTNKAVAAALKAERKRVADGVKALELPEGTTARAGAAIKKAVKEAVAAA